MVTTILFLIYIGGAIGCGICAGRDIKRSFHSSQSDEELDRLLVTLSLGCLLWPMLIIIGIGWMTKK